MSSLIGVSGSALGGVRIRLGGGDGDNTGDRVISPAPTIETLGSPEVGSETPDVGDAGDGRGEVGPLRGVVRLGYGTEVVVTRGLSILNRCLSISWRLLPPGSEKVFLQTLHILSLSPNSSCEGTTNSSSGTWISQ